MGRNQAQRRLRRTTRQPTRPTRRPTPAVSRPGSAKCHKGRPNDSTRSRTEHARTGREGLSDRIKNDANDPDFPERESDYLSACLGDVPQDNPETRRWHELFPDLRRSVMQPTDDRATAARLQQELTRHPDYDTLHIWLGTVLARLGERDQPRATYLKGLESCLRKSELCTEMASAEFDAGHLHDAVMWWIRAASAICNSETRSKNHTPFLSLAYVADAMGCSDVARRLLTEADKVAGEEYRFSAAGAAKFRKLTEAQGDGRVLSALREYISADLPFDD